MHNNIYLNLWIVILITLPYFNLTTFENGFESTCNMGSFSNCHNKTVIGDEIVCQICTLSRENMTVCETSNKKDSLNDLLNLIDDSIEYLHINLRTIWFGELPFNTIQVNLSGISRLRKLKKFHLISTSTPYSLHYSLKFNLSDFDNLKMLNTLRIRFHFRENLGCNKHNISEIIERLPELKLLDISNSKLGIESVTGILQKLNNTKITCLCLKQFQTIRSEGYRNDLSSHLWNDDKLKLFFPLLKELDISENSITRITSGFVNIFPDLRIIDVSSNFLLDVRNSVWILELILHPTLEVLNGNYQGCLDSFKSNELIIEPIRELTKKYKPVGDSLNLRYIKYIFHCMNVAGNGNISNIFTSELNTCMMLKCAVPVFKDLTCTGSTFIPSLSKVYNYACMMYITLPIGRKLKSIHFSYIQLGLVKPLEFTLAGKFCLWSNNSLELLEMSNNIWMENSQLGNVFAEISGTWNLNKLTTLLFHNNNVDINFRTELTNILPSLKVLNLAGNKLNFSHHYCKAAPNIETVDFQDSNIIDIQSNAVDNCLNLRNLHLGKNKLNITSLKSVNLSGNHNLKYIDLRDIGLQKLPQTFLKTLDNHNELAIDLSGNPLSCNCADESKNFLMWMKNRSSLMIGFQKYFCFGPHGLTRVIDVNDTTTFWGPCPDKYLKITIFCFVSVLVLFIIIALCLLIYKFRWRLQYIFFNLKLRYYALFEKSKDKKLIWRYDAFVSYSADDRFWVHDTFMKTLEETYGFRLCIHYRDFPVGGDIAETISETMSESRELIIILSDIAIKSEWCQFELDEALLHAYRRNKTLIVIKLGKIKENLLSRKVAHVLDNHTFLEWSDNSKCKSRNKLFWKKLVAKLYNNAYGEINFCCSFGAKSLGYKDIINPEGDSIVYEDVDEVPLSTEADKCRRRAKTLKKTANKARNFKKTLENDLQDLEELPHWAYGPIPWSIEELLKEDKDKFEDQTFKHADERIRLLINCLEKKYSHLNDLYQREMELFEDMIE